MRPRHLIAAAGVALLLGAGKVADAQTRGGATRSRAPQPAGPIDERFRVVVNGGVLTAEPSFGQDFTLTKNVEDTPVTTNIKPKTSGFIEVGGRAKVSRALWVGAVGFVASGTASGTLEAQVPHPFYFNQPRTVSGDLKDHTRSSTGVHVELAYAAIASPTREIAVFGGPSYINLKQELVTDFSYTDAYPFDAATFQAATKAEASKGGLGLNVGADAMWRIARRTWAGGLIRYSRADLTLAPAAGNRVDIKAGGVQAAAGIRVGF